jgi:hypothetical protein
MKTQKTISINKFQKLVSEHQEKDIDVNEVLSSWLEGVTDYEFTIVELGFILDLFSTINECETMGKSIRWKWKNYISRFDLK